MHCNIFDYYKKLIESMIGDMDFGVCDVNVESPRDRKFGDLTTNVAMVLTKKLKRSPMDIADEIKSVLSTHEDFVNISIVNPGFINWNINDKLTMQHLGIILSSDYGKSNIGKGEKINIEYVSANPTGPLHAGHARGAVIGDALARLLEYCGYDITKEYYINDAGNQIKNLAKSLYFRYMQIINSNNFNEDIQEGMYPGEYLIDIANDIVKQYGEKFAALREDEWIEFFKEFAVNKIMLCIHEDLDLLGVHHDVFTSEKELIKVGKVDECVKYLSEHGLVYTGILPVPKGKAVDDYEEREQLLFRSSKFGDDTDRPLKKSDGTWTYFATDIAYHFDKYQRGFSKMINFWGADHGGYIKRMVCATEAITECHAELSVKICQLVKFLDNGNEVKMSKRAGTFITARDVINKVGKDVCRFIMLLRKDDATLDFDFEKVVEHSRENSVFYVQYALARTYSVLSQFLETFKVDDVSFGNANFNPVAFSSNDISMIKTLMQWPKQVELAAIHREPHRIAFFLYDVASAFHSLWNYGKSDLQLRFINKDNYDVSLCRLAVVIATQRILESGLRVIGVTPIKELR